MEQKAYSVNQIKNERPNIPKTTNKLTGYVANSCNGGHNKTIFFKKIMAGEKHNTMRFRTNIQLLTPLTVAHQNLKATFYTYFVPNSRVWDNAEAYTAQKGGTTEVKINEIPNLGNKEIPTVTLPNGTKYLVTNTEQWRDTFAASYIPKIRAYMELGDHSATTWPPISVLPLRGRVAIYNDYERNKEYDEQIEEYKGDTVTNGEMVNYIYTQDEDKLEYYEMRAKKDNSYYSDYRTEVQGLKEDIPNLTDENSNLVHWAAWESFIAESRAQAENAQKNDWDIISEIRGSKKLTEGKVQLLSKKTVNLNYAAITQSAYNTQDIVREDFQVMGKQGGYSYTELDLLLYAGVEFIEEGYIHVIMNVSADTCYEQAIDRTLLDITPTEEYRPDLKDQKFDVLYADELSTSGAPWVGMWKYETIGFKRAFSQYFKLPNVCGGDMVSTPWIQASKEDYLGNLNEDLIPNDTYTFFQNGAYWFEDYITGNSIPLNIWKDYTDLLINKNQAIKQTICSIQLENSTNTRICGHNQIFLVGHMECVADLPISAEIKGNYTSWGEH